MQQQVMNRNMSSDMGWGIGEGGGWGQQSSTPGSGSWTSTANQESQGSGSGWQGINKSDSASDGGDDTSSVKSGSTITNMPSQSQESGNAGTTSTIQSSSSSPWSVSLPGMDSNPWGNSNSPAPSSIGSMGWSSNPSNLSLASSQNQATTGTSIIGNSSAFSTSNSSPSAWPSSMSGSLASTMPPNLSGSLQAGNLSSQWQGSTMLGNIGDFTKTSDSNWNSPASSINDNKENSSGSDPRLWGLSSDKPGESQWGTNAIASGGENNGSSSELSFAQATLKGLKLPPAPTAAQPTLTTRQEEFLRAIENHEGWGSRPIRQDTSWDAETSPKSHRKFSNENANPSNVWTNTNGTAIWEAVRESQSNNWAANAGGSSSWGGDKDQPNWTSGPKSVQDPTSWNPGSDSKPYGTWGAPGSSGDASASKMWGQKTEIGSWGETGVQRSTSIPSWGDDGDNNSWDDQQRRITGGMQNIVVPPSPGISTATGMPGMMSQGMNMPGMPTDTPPWNDKQQGWNQGGAVQMPRKMDETWNKPPPSRTGWGDPSQDSTKVDDGTSIWAANAPKQLPPQQTKPVGWGETAPPNQWSAAPGAKPKTTAGWDEASWAMAQRAKSGRDPDDLSSNSVEVGFWNGIPQDNNTWIDPAAFRGVRKITGQQMPSKYNGSSNNPPTQMRAKLLQHLMDLGYRKEEAQNALITNNMNLEMAIHDLKSSGSGLVRKDMDMDVFQTNGTQSRMPYMTKGGLNPDDMSDFRPDQVPSFKNVQNTPFPNAHIQNQPFLQNNTSLPPSSLTPNNSSINSSLHQQKLMQKMQQQQQQQQAPSVGALVSRGQMPPVGSSGATNSLPSLQHEQVMAQLRQAVKNGYISWQLLNYPLPHNILVLLQNLLHLQAALQGAFNKQHQIIQQARASGKRTNPPIDPTIANIQQQILMVQKQIQQEQIHLFNQKPMGISGPQSGMMTPQLGQQPAANMVDNLEALSSDLANVSLQPQSRLTTQWKSHDAPVSSMNDGLNQGSNSGIISSNSSEEKTDHGKGFQTSPNLNLIPGGLGMTGDRTWSSVPSTSGPGNWPMSSNETNIAQNDSKTVNSSTSSVLSDVIPEFIPGKPWQGLNRNVEDDPHVTPGSIQMHRSLSVNRVHDESLHNLDGHKLSSGPTWSSSGMKGDNSLGLSQLGSRPPPSMAPSKPIGSPNWQPNPINRQSSWAGRSGNSAFTQVGSNWNDNRSLSSSWIILKNLSPGLDSSTVRGLCSQYGLVSNFYMVAHQQLALVQFNTREAAFLAAQGLNKICIGNSSISADIIGEADAQRLTAQIPPPQPTAAPPMNSSPWSQAPPAAPFSTSGGRMADLWGNSVFGTQSLSKFGSGGSDPWDMPDHNSNLNNILGGETM